MPLPSGTKNNVTADEADVVLNRVNIALARSQKIISSWLPPPTKEDADHEQAQDDDLTFTSMTERGGIGSSAAYDNEGFPDGALQRKKLSSNDKLLEQLLGKKGAQMKKKSGQSGKDISISGHAAVTPRTVTSKRQTREVGSDEEEDGGRAAAFKSRKLSKAIPLSNEGANDVTEDSSDSRVRLRDGDISATGSQDAALRDTKGGGGSKGVATKARKKHSSYLDELLGHRAMKGRQKQSAVKS